MSDFNVEPAEGFDFNVTRAPDRGDRPSNVHPLKPSKLGSAMQAAGERLKELEGERPPLTPQQELELSCRQAANTPDATHIRLTLPKGCIISTAGDWIVVQYGPTAEQLACFNRYNGTQMPVEMLANLVQAPEDHGPAAVQVDQPVQFLDKAGRPLDLDAEVKLAKPGAAMLDLVARGGEGPSL